MVIDLLDSPEAQVRKRSRVEQPAARGRDAGASQVVDLTDPSVTQAPARVRRRAQAAQQDAVEIVGVQRAPAARRISGGVVRQGHQQPAQQNAARAGQAHHSAAANLAARGLGVVLGGLGLPGVTFPQPMPPAQPAVQAGPSIPQATAPKSPGNSPAKDDSSEAKCALCLDALKEDLCINPSCGHVFHYACIKASLVKYKCCPRCRKKINGERSLKRIYM